MDKVYIGTTNYGAHYLAPQAAASWFRMVRDGCPPSGITDALRTQEEQEAVFRRHYTTNYAASAKFDARYWNGQTWWRAYRPNSKTPWPSAATPGSRQARHVAGLSLDLNGATKAWVRANGHKYGWIKDLVSGEDWHMEYQSAKDAFFVSNIITPGTGLPLPNPDTTPIPDLEDDMYTEADRQRDQVTQNVMAERTAALIDEMRTLRESLSKVLAQREVILFYYTGDGQAYEADVKSGTYRAIPNPQALADRITVLTRTETPWTWWKGSPEAAAVDNLAAFGREVA